MEINARLLSTSFFVLAINFILAMNAHSRTEEPVPVYEDHLSIGPGFAYGSAPFEGLSGYATPYPTFSFRWGHFFGYNQHDEPTIGWELFQHKRIMLAIAASSGRTFLDVDDINDDKKFLYWGSELGDPDYPYIKNRDRAYEVGLIFRYFSRVGLFEAKSFHDVVSAYDGIRSTLSFSRPFPETGNWSIIPRLFVKHFSEKFNNYYYCVSIEETENADVIAVANGFTSYTVDVRPEYTPGNSAHWGADLTLEYKFNENFKATGYIGIEKFSGVIETSPLIEDKELTVTSLGLRYTF